MVYGIGINDMPKGWTSADSLNQRVYQLWKSMIRRCYDEKVHETHSTYKKCYVCERWLKLSNFVEDIVKIDGYNYWLSGLSEKRNPYQLDKDIKSGGTNKCYCLEQCQFVNYADNTRQANKTRDYEQFKGENNPMFGKHRYGEKNPRARKIVLVDANTKQPVFTWQYKQQATDFYGISENTLNRYLKGEAKTNHEYNGFLWFYAEQWEQLNK